MNLKHLFKILFPLFIGLIFFSSEIIYGETPEDANSENQFDVSYYKGKGVSNTFGSLFTEEWRYIDSEIQVVSLAYHLDGKIQQITFEAEGQVAKHEGIQDHWETNTLLNTRLTFFEDGLPIGISYGQGLSYAFGTPIIEQEATTKSNRLLNYFQLEMTFGLISLPYYPRIVLRIHHRSGVFGVYCEGTCGSNIPVIGVRSSF